MPPAVGSSAISDEETTLRDLDDDSLARLRDDWRKRFVVPNRFPGSSNSMFVKKARMVSAVEAEMRRRGLTDAEA